MENKVKLKRKDNIHRNSPVTGNCNWQMTQKNTVVINQQKNSASFKNI